MKLRRVGIDLLSALRKSGSLTSLAETNEALFSEDELKGLFFLKDYVRQHKKFPGPKTFTRETDITLRVVREPLAYYVDKATDAAICQGLVTHLSSLRDSLAGKDAEEVVNVVVEMNRLVNSFKSTHRQGVIDLDTALDMVVADTKEAIATIGPRGIVTGWNELDEMMGGHMKADLNSLIARPGRGKTYLLLHQAWAAHELGHSVLFVSNELSELQLIRRAVGISTKVNPRLLHAGQIGTLAEPVLFDKIDQMKGGAPFTVAVGSFRKTTESIRALAEELVPDIILVDASYLLIPERKRAGSSSRRETVSDVIEELKTVAIDIDRPIVQTVQFNRKAEQPKNEVNTNPMAHLDLSKIGETDVIGQASSVVMGIEIPAEPGGFKRRYIGFLKGREGESGCFEINYKFNPVDFSMIRKLNFKDDAGSVTADPNVNIDVSHMT